MKRIICVAFAAMFLGGCTGSMITAQDISDVTTSNRPVGATLTKLAEKGGAAREALTLWNNTAETIGLGNLTYDDEAGYIDLALTAAGILGAVLPISAKTNADGSPLTDKQIACDRLTAGNRDNEKGLAILKDAGCAV